jgi:hypothetical protein
MKANRLQLLLIPDPRLIAQLHPPPSARDESLELIAMMLVSVVRDGVAHADGGEVDDESR